MPPILKPDFFNDCPYRTAMQSVLAEGLHHAWGLKTTGLRLREAFAILPKTHIYGYFEVLQLKSVIPITTHELHKTDNPYRKIRGGELAVAVIENVGLLLEFETQRQFVKNAVKHLAEKNAQIDQLHSLFSLNEAIKEGKFVCDIVFDYTVDRMREFSFKHTVVANAR